MINQRKQLYDTIHLGFIELSFQVDHLNISTPLHENFILVRKKAQLIILYWEHIFVDSFCTYEFQQSKNYIILYLYADLCKTTIPYVSTKPHVSEYTKIIYAKVQ